MVDCGARYLFRAHTRDLYEFIKLSPASASPWIPILETFCWFLPLALLQGMEHADLGGSLLNLAWLDGGFPIWRFMPHQTLARPVPRPLPRTLSKPPKPRNFSAFTRKGLWEDCDVRGCKSQPSHQEPQQSQPTANIVKPTPPLLFLFYFAGIRPTTNAHRIVAEVSNLTSINNRMQAI